MLKYCYCPLQACKQCWKNKRKKRLAKWEDDVTAGADGAMQRRWDFLYVLRNYYYLEELERLISKSNILPEDSKSRVIKSIQKIKQRHPFLDRKILPSWKINTFTGDVLLLAGDLKKMMPMSEVLQTSQQEYDTHERVEKIIEEFWHLAKDRQKNYEEEIARTSQSMLHSTKLHTYYVQLVISMSVIALGIVIGFVIGCLRISGT